MTPLRDAARLPSLPVAVCVGGQGVPPYATRRGSDPEVPLGACPTCGRWSIQLTKNGRVRKHEQVPRPNVQRSTRRA